MLQSLLGFRKPKFAFQEQPQVQIITPTEVHQQLNQPAPPLVVDVRSPEEYEQDGHIIGSRLLPLPLLTQRSQELPQDRPIVLVCRSGNRSHIACEQLMNQGLTNVTNMVGGMIAWHRAGLPSK